MAHVAFPVALKVKDDFNGYTNESAQRKADLHVKGRTFLRNLAKRLGLETKDFEIRSNKAGPAVSGEVTLHSDSLYLQLSEAAMSTGIRLMYRGCKSRKDYCGLMNNYASVEEMSSVEGQDRLVSRLIKVKADGEAAAVK